MGRRWGKTVLGGALSMATSSQGGRVAWIVPTYKNGRSLWRWAESSVYPIKRARLARTNRADRIIEFANGGFFGIFSADNEDSIRGEAFHLVVLDEAARISETAWTDAIQPTLADYDGDALLISTPKGKNWFFYEYMRGKDDGVICASFQAPSSANPSPQIQRAAQLAKLRVPERTYKQEWLAKFVTDGAYFQNVDQAAVIKSPDKPEQHAGHFLVMGVDWAKSEDYTVFTVGCRDCNRVVDWERFNQIDFTYQREKLYSLAGRWGITGLLPERNSIGEPNIEIIREKYQVFCGPDNKPGFYTSPTTKPALIEGLANALEHSGFKVPKDSADELHSYEVHTRDNGYPSFGAPEGLHDDWPVSLALCYRAMTNPAYTILDFYRRQAKEMKNA